jgi:hypothetical protein
VNVAPLPMLCSGHPHCRHELIQFLGGIRGAFPRLALATALVIRGLACNRILQTHKIGIGRPKNFRHAGRICRDSRVPLTKA